MNTYDALANNPEHFHIYPRTQKKVLITGAGSFIGESFFRYAGANYPDNLSIKTIDMIDGSWRDADFSVYDAVFHVAGIAHADVGNVDEATRKKYYAVNCDLALETAKKAKSEGVGQFVFMSSAIVYGDSAGYGKKKHIDRYTKPAPANFYGDSKWQADKGLQKLAENGFKVAILRPPMIYGEGSKGNYPILSKLAKKLPVFPDVNNSRSMLYIDNLCEFLCAIILSGEGGVYFPQNTEYTRTADMVRLIANEAGHNILITKALNPFVALGSHIPGRISGLINKAFGSLTYDESLSTYKGLSYNKVSLKGSVKKTEGHKKRALMSASVASMIDLFSMDNIAILRDLGYEVDVACNFGPGSITSPERVAEFRKELGASGIESFDVPIPRSPLALPKLVSSYQKLRKLSRTRRYDIVHCQSPIGGVLIRLAFRKARQRGTRVIYTAHGFHFFDGAGRVAWMVYYPVEKALSKITDVLITINREDYERSKTFGAKKNVYIPGIGVHTAEFRNTETDREAKRRELGISPEDFVFMSTGQLSVRKNQEVVIRALAKTPNNRVKYLIVGFGESGEALKALTRELSLQDRVIFAGYRGDVRELLHAVDAFVFPSLQEGLPVALMEAMSVGLPIVCSSIRGNVDLLTDGEGGYLCDCHDPEGFAAAMKKVAEADSYERERMRQCNLNAMEHFDTNIVNKAMRELYKEVSL
ncbi:MAG: glycosyltransferase [Lachnospiraceae bacterium]|nr:glycosyltransferase [Lachnospiraceae bacterium]